MANQPRLQVSSLPPIGNEEASATASPARGAEMLNFLHTRLNQKNRAPPLMHSWDFWHDRQERSSASSSNGKTASPSTASTSYEDRLELLAHISDVKQFWSVFNNFDITQLKLRDSLHLFHKGVKPVWEDPRNGRGGSWTFRVSKSQIAEFWKDLCMLAIGEQLQGAVEDPARRTFRDDICGVSLSVRYNSMLVQIWNRDGAHQAGVEKVLQAVLTGVADDLVPREGSYFYKKHSEHAGFSHEAAQQRQSTETSSPATAVPGKEGGMQSLDAVMNA